MAQRQFGKTDMQICVLGFGGAEIGFEVTASAVCRTSAGGCTRRGHQRDRHRRMLPPERGTDRSSGRQQAERLLPVYEVWPPEGPSQEDWRPESLLQSIERSLRRLRTDRLDLVQLHSCSEAELRKGDVIAALQRARSEATPVTSAIVGQFGRAYAVECGQFDTLQTSVSIADQEALELTLPLARKQQMGVIAKRPLPTPPGARAETGQRLSPNLLGTAEEVELRLPARRDDGSRGDRLAVHAERVGCRHRHRRHHQARSLA